MTPTDLVLRPALPGDLTAIVDIHLRARSAAPMPPPAQSAAELAVDWRTRFGQGETWVAEAGGQALGYAHFTRTWLDDLYVLPEAAGHGVGGALLDLVKARLPRGFGLWVFVENAPARAFYAHRGLVEGEHTDGSQNAERCPDLVMEWSGDAPVGAARAASR